MSNTERDPFEFGGEPTPVKVTIGDKSKTYLFHDISKNDAEKIYAPVQEAKGDASKTAIANNETVTRTICAVVGRQDGSRISAEEVGQMRASLANKLALKCMAFMTGGDVDAAGEKEEAPEVEPAKND